MFPLKKKNVQVEKYSKFVHHNVIITKRNNTMVAHLFYSEE